MSGSPDNANSWHALNSEHVRLAVWIGHHITQSHRHHQHSVGALNQETEVLNRKPFGASNREKYKSAQHAVT
jgi:hypothetical protein